MHLYNTIAPFAGDAPTPDANRRGLTLFLNRVFDEAPQLKRALDPAPLEGTDEWEVWSQVSRELYLALSFRTGDTTAELAHLYRAHPARSIINSLEALYEPDVPLQRLIALSVCDYASAAALRVALNDLFLRITEMSPEGKAKLLLLATVAATWDPKFSYEALAFNTCSVITTHSLLPKAKDPPLNFKVRTERRSTTGDKTTTWRSYHKTATHTTAESRAKPPGWSDSNAPPHRS